MTGMDCLDQINECSRMKVRGREICEHGFECVNVPLGESGGDSGKIYKGDLETGYNCVGMVGVAGFVTQEEMARCVKLGASVGKSDCHIRASGVSLKAGSPLMCFNVKPPDNRESDCLLSF